MIEVLHMVLPSRTLFYSLSNEKMERFFGSLLDLELVIHRDRRVVHVFLFNSEDVYAWYHMLP